MSGIGIATRLRRAGDARTGNGRLLVRGGRLAGLLLGGSAIVALVLELAMHAAGSRLADPLALPFTSVVPPSFATWGFVLLESSLLPHPLPGSDVWIWGAGSLPLMVAVLVTAFRAGGELVLRPLDLLVMLLPSLAGALLVAGAEVLTGSSWRVLALSLLVPVPAAVAAAAGARWRVRRDSRAIAPLLRALAAAAFVLPFAAGLAAIPVLLAPAGSEPSGLWVWMLLPFVPNAILRGALDGFAPLDSLALAMVVVAAVGVGVHLSRRSFAERAWYAVAVTAILAGATAASTPVTSFDAVWPAFTRALSAAVLAGIAGAVAGPYLGSLRLGHRITDIAALRAIGDLLPPPAASEITDLGAVEPVAAARSRRAPGLRIGAVRPEHAGRILAGAATGVLVLLAATATYTVLSTGTAPGELPEVGAAQAYLAAIGSGSADRAWTAVSVDASALPAAAQPRLLGRDDLARMLRLEANTAGAPSGLRVDVAGHQGDVTVVHARYSDAAGQHDVVLDVARRAGGWKVVLVPAGLALPSTAVARVMIDGAPVAVDGNPVAVLPGAHQVTVEYPAPFAPQQATVVADRPYASPVSAPVGARLDDAAMASARSTVAAALRTCLASSAARPTGCPQAVDAPAGTAVRWSLVGDPAQSLVVLPDERGGVVAHGQFQMVAAYDVHLPDDVKHAASGGSFRAPLSWNGGHWSVAGSVDPDIADVARPPIVDTEVVAAVLTGFEHCATSALLRPADCPQSVPSQFFVKDVAWKLSGYPVAGAAVTFDPHRGVLAVTGSYAMNVSYLEGGDTKTATSGGRYRAELFWDGSRLVLVAINPA